jgi:hypothetical protein
MRRSCLDLLVWAVLGAASCAAVSLVLGNELDVVLVRAVVGGLVVAAFMSEVAR